MEENNKSNKILQFAKYLLFLLIVTTVYGFGAHFMYKTLAELSILFAYLNNMFFIVFLLVLSKSIQTKMNSKKFVFTKKNLLFARFAYWDSIISFNTPLYLFYIFILIVSQIYLFDPTIVSEDFGNFMRAMEYGIIFVIAFDKLIEYYFKDRERMKLMSAKFKQYLSEKSD